MPCSGEEILSSWQSVFEKNDPEKHKEEGTVETERGQNESLLPSLVDNAEEKEGHGRFQKYLVQQVGADGGQNQLTQLSGGFKDALSLLRCCKRDI